MLVKAVTVVAFVTFYIPVIKKLAANQIIVTLIGLYEIISIF